MKLEIDKFFLKNDRLLDSLPAQVTAILEEGMTQVRAKKGRVIYREDSFSKGLYILKKGKVKIYRTTRSGSEQILYIYSAGEMIGFRPLLYDGKHPVSAAALEECSYYLIHREQFLTAVDQSPELARALLAQVSREFSVWVNLISVFAQQPVKSRVALGLLIFDRKYRIKGKPGEINLSRDDFAAFIGTAKETLVRVLKEFKEDRIVESHGRKIRVLKHAPLEDIASYY
jgi:CRP-like cAMP-binding protein